MGAAERAQAGELRAVARQARLAVGKGALSLVVELATIFVLVLLLLLEGPRMRTGILGQMSADRAARIPGSPGR